MSNILIVEDEPKLAMLLKDYLVAEQFVATILSNGTEVVPFIKNSLPDLILLDIMLPNKNGLEICKEIRGFSAVPIIMITARVEEIDRLLGLELGADDYICKPFSPREVVARVKAVLRRGKNQVEPSFGKTFVINKDNFEVFLNNQPLDLTPIEFRLLSLLASKPGRVFSRDSLMSSIYEDNRVVTDRTVDAHIKNLRRKISALEPNHDYIQSIYGVGYRFEELLTS